MNLTKHLQQELKTRGVLTVRDVMKICDERGVYYDTARRILEPSLTPNARKIKGAKGRVAKWVWTERPLMFNEDSELEQLTLI
jgi:hypothetical protein